MLGSRVTRCASAVGLLAALIAAAHCGTAPASRECASCVAAPARGPRVTGSQFAARIAAAGEDARDAEILAAITAGHVPASVRPTWPVPLEARGHRGVLYVAPDYIGVGVEADWLRTPLRAATAQQVADRLGALLPTRRMVDRIAAAAALRLPFIALRPHDGAGRCSTDLYVEHNRAIERHRAGRAGLAAGHKKDVVVGECVRRNPGHVLIYGGWYAGGERVQPLSAAHHARYVDYSHGVRLIAPVMLVDGRRRRVLDVLADPVLSELVSDEGPVASARY